MKSLLPLLLLSATALFAEPVTVRESVILKAERAAIAVKAGTEVELVARDGDTVTIRYRNVTGKIPASKLAEAAAPVPAKAETKQPVATKPAAAVPATAPRPPQTTYGKAVQKAKDNAAAHDKHVVESDDEILKE